MRLLMMGTGAFAGPTFKALLASSHLVAGLVTNPDRPSGREREMQRGMKKIALEHNVPLFQPESINTSEGVAGLKAFQPDLLVVAAYGQILSKEALSVPRYGGINVHASLLPKYRGAAPVPWAIYNGETRTGVTIIKMSVSLDAGDMLAQEVIEIGPEETAGELEARLAPLGAKLALQVIDQIAAGTVQGVKQDKTQVTKAPKLTKEHGLIDWSRHGRDICNQIRAMQPWPSAYTFLHRPGQACLRVIIHKAGCEPANNPTLHPGQPLDSKDALKVGAGAGTVVDVRSLQPAGKRAMSASEFLHGHRVQAGDYFGPEGL